MRFLVPALVCLVSSAAAQPASDLLQSGIYSQDTLGDLNGAIRIYRQILASGSGLRLYAAHAQYRLGTCLLRKGDTAGAIEAFQTVIREYADQPDLAARARASLPAGNELLRAPWSQTEVAEYRWTIPGVQDGWSICRIGADRGSTWRIQMSVYAPKPFVTQVDVDQNTMRPLLFNYRAPTGRQARVAFGGSNGSAGYGYGELPYLLRRMPLAAGWSTKIPVIAEQQMSFSLSAAVTGVEEVAVQAGKFKCVRVRLTGTAPHNSVVGTDWPVGEAGETLWYGVNGARPLVKIESGSFRGELASLRTGEQIGTTSYRDPQVGYSFTVPAGWVFHPRASFSPPGTSVDLLDPESQVWVVISGKSKRTDLRRIDAELMDGARERMGQAAGQPGVFKIRGSLLNERVGGHASLSWIADHFANGRKSVTYLTWIQSEHTRASIAVQIDAADFERFRERFQPILDSFRMP